MPCRINGSSLDFESIGLGSIPSMANKLWLYNLTVEYLTVTREESVRFTL